MLKNLVLFTASGEGLPVAYNGKLEGLNVVVGVVQDWKDVLTDDELKNGKANSEKPVDRERRLMAYDGMLEKKPIERVVEMLKNIPNEEKQEWFIYNDMNYTWRFAEQVMDLGIPGNFPTQEDRIMECDREKAKQFVMKNYPDLKLTEVQEFKTAQEGIEFLSDTEDVWVLKGNDADSETVVPFSEDPYIAGQQLINALEDDKKNYEKAGYILERKIVNALELTPMICFFNGQVVFTDLDIELKRKGAGDCGRMIGCAANLVMPIPEKCQLSRMAFPPVVYKMAQEHMGMFVIDASILFDPENGQGYFGEFCTRLGYDAFFTEVELAGGVTNFFSAVMQGKNPYATAVGKYGMAVRMLNEEPDHDVPGKYMPGMDIFVDDLISRHVWLFDVRLDEGKMKTIGYGPDLAVVTAAGDDLYSATDRVFYYFKEGFGFKNGYYRPGHDIVSTSYPGSIPNRLDYASMRGLLYEPSVEAVPSMATIKN